MCSFAGCEPAIVSGSPTMRALNAQNLADALSEITRTLTILGEARRVSAISPLPGERKWNAPGIFENFARIALNKARNAVGLPQVPFNSRLGFDAEADFAIQQTIDVIADLLTALNAASALGEDTAAQVLLLLVFVLRKGEEVCDIALED